MAKLRLIKGRRTRYVLVYAMRLFPEGAVEHLQGVSVTQRDGTTVAVTPHLIEGTAAQIQRQLARSVDAFFELHAELDEPP
ncbi:MAG TPA: allantoinase [Candidatus Kryptonia bacterium]|nr:allantoinase [Candidatus Kryptonia bacterium]